MIVESISKAFQSDRLIYRAVENTDEIKQFLNNEIENDPASIALADPGLVRPRGMKHAEWLVENLMKAVLGVIICLPVAGSESGDSAKAAVDSEDVAAPTRKLMVKPMGFLVIGWGGEIPGQSRHRSTGIGISLAAPYQDQGYGSEAINWAMDWTFRFGGYHRLAIGTVSYNERAVHLYKRLGFVEEGRSRQAHWHDRRWYDKINYSILEHEWAALRGVEDH
jgi:GNAT superfamily N-acetyltransferase